MITNAVQDFLRAGGTIEELAEKYSISSKRSRKYSNLILFKYNMIESPMGEKIVQDARGVILDENNNWTVVSWAFSKFFNHLEGHAAVIDWNNCRVQTKEDGSLLTIYYYAGNWEVATSGTPDGFAPIGSEADSKGGEWEPILGTKLPIPSSFSNYFWQILKLRSPELLNLINEDKLPHDVCFYFELMGSLNRIVVVHPEAKVVLLGARNVVTGQEYTTQYANDTFLQGTATCVKEYSLNSIEEIVATFEHISPLSQEGYVVVDDKFNRIKVKSPAYVALHLAKDQMTTKAFVQIVRTGETSEIVSYFPEFKPFLDEVSERYNKFLKQIINDYDKIKHIQSQKEFAIEAVKTKCSAALFMLRAKKISSIKEYLQTMQIDRLMDYLDY